MVTHMCILTPEGLRQEDHGVKASLKNTGQTDSESYAKEKKKQERLERELHRVSIWGLRKTQRGELDSSQCKHFRAHTEAQGDAG